MVAAAIEGDGGQAENGEQKQGRKGRLVVGSLSVGGLWAVAEVFALGPTRVRPLATAAA